MSYRQVELGSENTRMICWVEDDPRLKEGVTLTLKEIPGVTWSVKQVYGRAQEQQRRTWRVGGVNDR